VRNDDGILTSKIDFLVGNATNRIAVGSATPTYTSGSLSFSIQDFDEVRAANGDAYLSNLLRLMVLLDSNNDTTDGFQIDAAASNAVSAAVTGTKTLDFAGSAAAFGADATIAALATALNRTLISGEEALVRYQLLFRQSRSSSIALTGDDNRAVVVNRQKASVSVIRVTLTTPEANVTAATRITPAVKPNLSAATPATIAPTTYPRSRQSRYTPTAELRHEAAATSPIVASRVG